MKRYRAENIMVDHVTLFFRNVFIYALVTISPVIYAETKDVVSHGRAVVSGNITLAQAKQQALNMARSLAVEKTAGVTVNSSVLLQNSLIVTEFVNTFSFGYLIDEEILGWKGSWSKESDGISLGMPIVEVAIQGRVTVPDQTFYRNYILDANLDKKSFVNGESVSIRLSSTEDVYILVVNYTADNKIVPIYPNDIRGENILSKHKKVILPGPYSSEFNISVYNIPGHKVDTEAFIVFGFPVDRYTENISWADIYPAGKEIAYSNFFKSIMQLPITWIAQKTLMYNILSE